jgi:hypothetical protein
MQECYAVQLPVTNECLYVRINSGAATFWFFVSFVSLLFSSDNFR